MKTKNAIKRLRKLLNERRIDYDVRENAVHFQSLSKNRDTRHTVIVLENGFLLFVSDRQAIGFVDYGSLSRLNSETPIGSFICIESEDEVRIVFKTSMIVDDCDNLTWGAIERHCLLGEMSIGAAKDALLKPSDNGVSMYL